MSTKPNTILPQLSMFGANKDVSFAVGMALVLAVLFLPLPPILFRHIAQIGAEQAQIVFRAECLAHRVVELAHADPPVAHRFHDAVHCQHLVRRFTGLLSRSPADRDPFGQVDPVEAGGAADRQVAIRSLPAVTHPLRE